MVRQEMLTEEVNRLIIANLIYGLENAESEEVTDRQGLERIGYIKSLRVT